MNNTKKVLEVKDLKIDFAQEIGSVTVVNGISFDIYPGETLGLVGESGCGKSVTSLSIMGLLDTTPGKVYGGEINYKGENLAIKNDEFMSKIRGNEISMIFQEPMTSLNPVMTIGEQLDEVLYIHTNLNKKQIKDKSIEMLEKVKIPRPDEVYKSYPHELSGGMRQRVMIAIALACEPKLLIADEPTTALDVTIQAQILELMGNLKEETETSILFITHDLGVVAQMCDRVMVMYAGELVEQGDVVTIFKTPKHPYTKGLLKSIPKLGESRGLLPSIKGQVPAPGTIETGCKFAPRCEEAMDICKKSSPELLLFGKKHSCRCHLYEVTEEVV